ncbi:MAG: YwiC-like family protein [Ilumatobacter sp.]|nr:YwiC-like family protein [Ilumatobacter sp.]
MEPRRRRPPMHLDLGGTDDFWTHPERRHESHVRTTVLLVAAIVFIAAWSAILTPSILILAVMLVPAAVMAGGLAWHTRERRIPDYTDGAPTRRRRFRPSGR